MLHVVLFTVVSVLDEGRMVHSGVLTYPDACTTMLVEIPTSAETQVKVI
jgi:hypothetical protein